MQNLGLSQSSHLLLMMLLLPGCKEATLDEKWFSETQKYADNGSYHSQIQLGTYYEKGKGTTKNTDKAIECYVTALDLMHAEKQKLPTTLEGWKKLASEEGHERKIDYLIGLYHDGGFRNLNGDVRIENPTGQIVEDINEARKWYERYVKDSWAVDIPDAYFLLSELCDNPESAHDYLTTASAQGSTQAKLELSLQLIYEKRYPDVYEKGKRRSVIRGGNEDVFTKDMGRFFSGIKLLKDSSDLGCSVASHYLYSIYSDWRHESPFGRDEKQAWHYKRKHEEQQMVQSSCRLWFLYWRQEPSLASLLPYSKQGVETILQNKIRALRGDPESIFTLSVCHHYGQGVPKDPDEALRLCKQSAVLGYPPALLSMGNRYYDGTGVIKDEIEAYAYWNLAGVNLKEGAEYIAEMEKKLTESARLLGQKRSRELQAEIEAKKSEADHK